MYGICGFQEEYLNEWHRKIESKEMETNISLTLTNEGHYSNNMR